MGHPSIVVRSNMSYRPHSRVPHLRRSLIAPKVGHRAKHDPVASDVQFGRKRIRRNGGSDKSKGDLLVGSPDLGQPSPPQTGDGWPTSDRLTTDGCPIFGAVSSRLRWAIVRSTIRLLVRAGQPQNEPALPLPIHKTLRSRQGSFRRLRPLRRPRLTLRAEQIAKQIP